MSANCMKAKMLSAALFAALVLSAMQSVRADEATYNYWEGDSGNSWTDKDSETGKYKWTTGTLPTATETAAFKQGVQTVKIKDGICLAAKVVFESGSVITFSRLDFGTVDAVTAGEFSGEGTLKLLRTGLKAAYAGCTVSVAGFEVLHDNSYPSNYSWLDGGTAESEKMVVESAVTGSGNLACNNYVEVNGDVTLTGSLKLSANATVKNLVYDNGGCKIASDSAGGTIEKVTVKSGTLEYSSSTLKSVSAITVGKFVLDGGTLSVSSDFIGTIAVAEGGGTLFLEGKWNDDASVSLPAGLSFAEGADLSKVTVQATIGESTRPATFAIAYENEACSLEYVGYPFHLEELDLSWMTSGWQHPVANKSIYSISDGSYTSLRLWNGTEWQTYSRGISVQTESHWFINLGGEGKSFSATVGLDKSADGDGRNGSKKVKFAVVDVVGGTNLVETDWMGTTDTAATLTADLTGVELIDLVAYKDEKGGDGWQHVDWCNPVIVMAGDAAPVTKPEGNVNRWTGNGADTKWSTAANWEFGVPRPAATAVFDADAEVYLGSNKTTVSNLVVNAGATVALKTTDLYAVWPSLYVQEVNGEGTLQLWQSGLAGTFDYYSTVNVNVAEIESLYVWRTNWGHEGDNWINGPQEDGKQIVVNSKVTGDGYFRIRDNVTVKGEVRVTGQLDLGSDTEGAETTNAKIEKYVFTGTMPKIINGTLAVPDMFAIRGGTYDCVANAGASWQVALDGGTVDVGTGATVELAVVSGGYIRMTASETPTTLPGGVTFAADADLSNVFAIVTDTTAGTQTTYAIAKTGDAYILSAATPGDTVTWIGGGADSNWNTAGNWLYSAVPTAGQAVVFNYSADVIIDQDVVLPAISTLTVGTGAEVSLRYRCTSGDVWWHGGKLPVVTIQKKVTGDGTLRLQHVELVGAEGASVECAELEILPFENNDEWRDTKITGPTSGSPFAIAADVSGGGYLHMNNRLALSGDNSGFAGRVVFSSSDADGKTDRYFNAPESFFPNASPFEFYGKAFIGFTEGTARLGNVTMGESWGAAFLVKYGAQVIFEVESGSIRDTHFGNGFEVHTCAQDSETDSNSTDGCAGLTIKKVGEGTLVYGVTKAHNLVVAKGRVEFTGENNNYDDADVNVTVKAGASIGSSEAFSHENPNWTLGGDVTHGGTFTFDDEESVAKVYVEAGDATEATASAKRTLTLSGNNKAFTTMVTADPALNQWLDGDAAEREAKLNTPNSHGINGIQAYMIGYPTFTDDTVPSLAVGVSGDNFSFNFDIGKSSARKVDGLAVNYSLKSSSDMVNWKNVGSATVSGGAVAASAEALSTGGPYVKLCAEVVPTESE